MCPRPRTSGLGQRLCGTTGVLPQAPRCAIGWKWKALSTFLPFIVRYGRKITVHDPSSEVRWLVLPERPVGTEGLSEDQLVPLITRDSMAGVARLEAP